MCINTRHDRGYQSPYLTVTAEELLQLSEGAGEELLAAFHAEVVGGATPFDPKQLYPRSDCVGASIPGLLPPGALAQIVCDRRTLLPSGMGWPVGNPRAYQSDLFAHGRFVPLKVPGFRDVFAHVMERREGDIVNTLDMTLA